MFVTMDLIIIWIIIISAILLFIFALSVIIYCICWESKNPGIQHFYILEEGGLKKTTTTNSLSSLNFFRNFTSSSTLRDNNVFTSDNLPIINLERNYEIVDEKESKLVDSMEVEKKFNDSILVIDRQNSKKDDMESCISEDSRHSFYSTFSPFTRQNSEADNYASLE
ncbi:unnamed protein product [Brassicogethes aeneus]|uniref:Uncharacterized protein n=1 Tax=Brassicogethes aeneus TaxID=1431903 RepID=A0A9P0BIU0_BRAAE|nr:unnamed protein product [Brassicogethes aeneus]